MSDAVLVLTGEGSVKRGRRLWHPGKTIGTILSRHTLHERAWNVRINGMTVILFRDEFEWSPVFNEPCNPCGRPRAEFPRIFASDESCSVTCDKRRKREAASETPAIAPSECSS